MSSNPSTSKTSTTTSSAPAATTTKPTSTSPTAASSSAAEESKKPASSATAPNSSGSGSGSGSGSTPTLQELEHKLNVLPNKLQHKAAGIIIVAEEGDKKYVCMGVQDSSNPKKAKWKGTLGCPSGGVWTEEDDKKKGDMTFARSKLEKFSPLDTAAREAYEETEGMLGSMDEIRAMLLKPSTFIIKNAAWIRYELDPVNNPNPFITVLYVVYVKGRAPWVDQYNAKYSQQPPKEGAMRSWHWIPLNSMFQGIPYQDEAQYTKTEFYTKLFTNDENYVPPYDSSNPVNGTALAGYIARSLFLFYGKL